jgi:hypothetical protein
MGEKTLRRYRTLRAARPKAIARRHAGRRPAGEKAPGSAACEPIRNDHVLTIPDIRAEGAWRISYPFHLSFESTFKQLLVAAFSEVTGPQRLAP